MCQRPEGAYRSFQEEVEDLVDKARNESKPSEFVKQFSSWNKFYRPTFNQIPTRRGFGYSFNIVEKSKMFREE